MKPNERGEFALGFRMPRVIKRIAGRDVEVELTPLGQAREEFEMDDLLAGVTQDDLRGQPSGFMREMERQGGAGAGPDVGEKPQHRDIDYGLPASEDDSPDQLDLGDDSSMDLFGQPQGRDRGISRTEYGDIVPGRRPEERQRRPNEYVDDDYADMSQAPAYRSAACQDERFKTDEVVESDLVRMFRGDK